MTLLADCMCGIQDRIRSLWTGLTKQLCSSLIEFVAVAAQLPHEFASLLNRNIVLAGEVVNTIGLVRLTPPDSNLFRPLCHARVLSQDPARSVHRKWTAHNCGEQFFYLIGTGALKAARPASVMR
jgi:hypothetical protein